MSSGWRPREDPESTQKKDEVRHVNIQYRAQLWAEDTLYTSTHPKPSKSLRRVCFRDELGGSLCVTKEFDDEEPEEEEEGAKVEDEPECLVLRGGTGWSTAYPPAPDPYGYVDGLAAGLYLAARNALTQPVGLTERVLRLIEGLSGENAANVGLWPTKDYWEPPKPDSAVQTGAKHQAEVANPEGQPTAKKTYPRLATISEETESEDEAPSATGPSNSLPTPPPSAPASPSPSPLPSPQPSPLPSPPPLPAYPRPYFHYNRPPPPSHPHHRLRTPSPPPPPPPGFSPWDAELVFTTTSFLRNYFLLLASFIRHQPLTSPSAAAFTHPNLLRTLSSRRRLRVMADAFAFEATGMLREAGSVVVGEQLAGEVGRWVGVLWPWGVEVVEDDVEDQEGSEYGEESEDEDDEDSLWGGDSDRESDLDWEETGSSSDSMSVDSEYWDSSGDSGTD
ncbi:hypothetical protein QBC39DRAFT_405944 [Podospora conica]|nr:hypothetical protein QBC39DRAFT_405944 [Schizothecium conicum]